MRLRVRAPIYRDFTIRARVEAQPRRNPVDVDAAVRSRLRDSFTLTARAGLEPRKFGAAVSTRDIAAAIRKVAGVRRVLELELQVDGAAVDTLELARHELPRLDFAASRIDIERAGGTT